MTNEKIMKSYPHYLTTKEFVKKHTFLPMGGLRHLLFNARSNGLEQAILRLGKRKILISEEGFFQWLEEKNSRGGLHV